jgi:hypothetical protein
MLRYGSDEAWNSWTLNASDAGSLQLTETVSKNEHRVKKKSDGTWSLG